MHFLLDKDILCSLIRIIQNHTDAVYKFLQKLFLYWLEAISLIREVLEGIYMINSLQLLVYIRHLLVTLLVTVLYTYYIVRAKR